MNVLKKIWKFLFGPDEPTLLVIPRPEPVAAAPAAPQRRGHLAIPTKLN